MAALILSGVAASASGCAPETPDAQALRPLTEVDAFEKRVYSHDSDSDTSEFDPVLDVAKAKERARAIENHMAAFVPADAIVGIIQKPTGILLECDPGANTFMWSGHTQIDTAPGVDWDAIVGSVAADAQSKAEMKIKRDRHDDGLPRVILSGTRGESYVFSVHLPRQLSITSYSPCFKRAAGLSSAGQF